MGALYFSDYGCFLDWLEPEDFYEESWSCYDRSKGVDGETYEVVINTTSGELRYTII